MARLYRQEFTVSGSGRFPIDMLRYDACFPAHEADSAIMGHEDEHRTVRLARYWCRGMAELTDRRWQSFGWRVETCDHLEPVAV